jgi:hypothetical protein
MQLFVQSLNLLFDRSSPFELVDGEIVYIHGASKYSKPVEKSSISKIHFRQAGLNRHLGEN